MLKRLFMLTVVAVLFVCGAVAKPVIKFDKSSHNFGNFKESQVMQYNFVFTNTGDEDLVIQQAFSSCGCTIANFTKEPIAPGEKGKISVTYNGKGKFPGHFKKPVTIRSNAANTLVRVYIEGNMTTDD